MTTIFSVLALSLFPLSAVWLSVNLSSDAFFGTSVPLGFVGFFIDLGLLVPDKFRLWAGVSILAGIVFWIFTVLLAMGASVVSGI